MHNIYMLSTQPPNCSYPLPFVTPAKISCWLINAADLIVRQVYANDCNFTALFPSFPSLINFGSVCRMTLLWVSSLSLYTHMENNSCHLEIMVRVAIYTCPFLNELWCLGSQGLPAWSPSHCCHRMTWARVWTGSFKQKTNFQWLKLQGKSMLFSS